MAIESHSQWEATITKKLNRPKAEEVWPLLEDFCSFNKWLPSIDMCYKVKGVEGRPSLVRYCATTLPPPDGGKGLIKWCHEKLMEVNPKKKYLSYEVLDNNMGFKTYESTLEVLPSKEGVDDDDDAQKGCLIEWSFMADPIEGPRFEDMVAYLDYSLQGMAENIERAFEK